jgi:hypothetical protein
MLFGGNTPKQTALKIDEVLREPGFEKYGNVGLLDRELRGLKFRHTEFPGLRVPSAALSLNQSNNLTMT